MGIFNYNNTDALGKVSTVDTGTVIVRVDDVEKLRHLQVNRLVCLQSSRPGEHLIGVVQKIVRSLKETKTVGDDELTDGETMLEENIVRVALIGTHIDRRGTERNVFRRTLETVPEIDASCFSMEEDNLTEFMRIIANVSDDKKKLELGTYTLDERAVAYLNGNKFFQRHAIIVGSTGSGKSWTTARILEQVAGLPNANALVFDLHGEYEPLQNDGIRHFRVAGSSDLDKGVTLEDEVLHLPYCLLGYEAMISMFVDRSDQNAPNQAMLMSRTITEAKKASLEKEKRQDILGNFTIDSPIPFDLDYVFEKLKELDTQMVPGSGGRERQGPYHGKLSRLIARLENKRTDRRLGFLFQGSKQTNEYKWLETLCSTLIGGARDQSDGKGGVKIIDFSEVPSDILPLIVSLIARLAFSLQQWMAPDKRHPIALFCDEAHLYPIVA